MPEANQPVHIIVDTADPTPDFTPGVLGLCLVKGREKHLHDFEKIFKHEKLSIGII